MSQPVSLDIVEVFFRGLNESPRRLGSTDSVSRFLCPSLAGCNCIFDVHRSIRKETNVRAETCLFSKEYPLFVVIEFSLYVIQLR